MSFPVPDNAPQQRSDDAGDSAETQSHVVAAGDCCCSSKEDVEPSGNCPSSPSRVHSTPISCSSADSSRRSEPVTMNGRGAYRTSPAGAASSFCSLSDADSSLSRADDDRRTIVDLQNPHHVNDGGKDGIASSNLSHHNSNTSSFASVKLPAFAGSDMWQMLQNQLNALITSELYAGNASAACGEDRTTVATENEEIPGRESAADGTRTAPSFGPATAMAAASPSLAKRNLREADRAELASVEQLYKTAFDAVPCAETLEAAQRGHGADYFALKARRIVTSLWLFAKGLPPFVGLPAETQERLLRAGLTSCVLLRSAHFYDLAAERWTDEHGTSLDTRSLAADVEGSGFADGRWVWAEHERMSREFRMLVPDRSTSTASSASSLSPANASVDLAVYALLQAIVLLSPERGDPVRDDCATLAAVSDGALHYTMLLRRHLEASHSFVCAADLLPQLLERIAGYKQFAVPFSRCMLAAPTICRESSVADAMAATAAMSTRTAAEQSQCSSRVENQQAYASL